MADQRLKDRIVVITGASSGIGKATAIKFAQAGARIICADLKSSGVEEQLNSAHGPKTSIFVPCDVSSETQIQALVLEAVAFGGRLDCILNYAGIARESTYPAPARCHDFETEDFDKEMAINTRGVWLCCKYALQQMLIQEPLPPNARGERTRGWIVNCASMLGLTASANTPAYVPSKFAVVGMTKQMAIDYAKDRIHINALCPGFVDTPIIATVTNNAEAKSMAEMRHPWNSLGRAEDIADAALFLCSDEAAWVTGHSMVVDGGWTAM